MNLEARLAPRERQLVTLLCSGKTIAETATEMHISTTSVKNSIANVYRKVDVHNRMDLFRYALRVGLTER